MVQDERCPTATGCSLAINWLKYSCDKLYFLIVLRWQYQVRQHIELEACWLGSRWRVIKSQYVWRAPNVETIYPPPEGEVQCISSLSVVRLFLQKMRVDVTCNLRSIPVHYWPHRRNNSTVTIPAAKWTASSERSSAPVAVWHAERKAKLARGRDMLMISESFKQDAPASSRKCPSPRSANQTMSRDMWRGGRLKLLKYNVCCILKINIQRIMVCWYYPLSGEMFLK